MKPESKIRTMVNNIINIRKRELTEEQIIRINKVFEREIEEERLEEENRKTAISNESMEEV